MTIPLSLPGAMVRADGIGDRAGLRIEAAEAARDKGVSLTGGRRPAGEIHTETPPD